MMKNTIFRAMRRRYMEAPDHHKREGRVVMWLPDYMVEEFAKEFLSLGSNSNAGDPVQVENAERLIRAGQASMFGCKVKVIDSADLDLR